MSSGVRGGEREECGCLERLESEGGEPRRERLQLDRRERTLVSCRGRTDTRGREWTQAILQAWTSSSPSYTWRSLGAREKPRRQRHASLLDNHPLSLCTPDDACQSSERTGRAEAHAETERNRQIPAERDALGTEEAFRFDVHVGRCTYIPFNDGRRRNLKEKRHVSAIVHSKLLTKEDKEKTKQRRKTNNKIHPVVRGGLCADDPEICPRVWPQVRLCGSARVDAKKNSSPETRACLRRRTNMTGSLQAKQVNTHKPPRLSSLSKTFFYFFFSRRTSPKL